MFLKRNCILHGVTIISNVGAMPLFHFFCDPFSANQHFQIIYKNDKIYYDISNKYMIVPMSLPGIYVVIIYFRFIMSPNLL